MLGADTQWWRDAVAPLVAAFAGIGGVWIGHYLIRGRELRAVRLTAYVDWMTAVRNIVTWVGPDPQPGDTITIPHPDRLNAFNEATVALSLVASNRVMQATRAYRDGMHTWLARGGTQQASDVRQIMESYNEALTPYRQRTLSAMRRDLIGGWRRWKAADPAAPSTPNGTVSPTEETASS